MTQFQLKEGNGTAFRNKRKSESREPDFTGEILLDGKLRFLDVWVRQTKANDNYFSIRVGNEKKPRTNDDYQRPVDKPVMDQTRHAALDDEVPF